MNSLEIVTPAIESKINSMGFDLYGIKYFRAGKKSILRLFIDKPGGITVKECEQVSHEIAMVLDVEEFSGTSYTLEVSSPGTDWPLSEAKDYIRIIGHDATIRLKDPFESRKKITGTIVSCQNEIITIIDKNMSFSIPLSNIETGRTEIKFN